MDEADQSLQFTTGGTTGDSHNLDSVEVAIEEITVSAEMAVSLYSDASGVPGSSLFTFTNPTGGVTSGAVNTFTAPDNTTLTGGTPYHIVVSSPSVSGTFVRVHLERTNSDAEDDAGEDDWGIGNFGYSLSGTTWSSSSRVMQIRVNGTAGGRHAAAALDGRDAERAHGRGRRFEPDAEPELRLGHRGRTRRRRPPASPR